jgi:hypothetical protein
MLIGRKRAFVFDSVFQKTIFISLFGAGLTCVVSVVFMGCGSCLLTLMHYPKPMQEAGIVLKHFKPAAECAKEHVFLLFLYGCLLAPVFEEIVFRLPLVYSKKNFTGALLAYTIGGGFVSQNALCRLINGTYFDFSYKIPLLCLIAAFILLILSNIKAVDHFFNLLFNRHWLWFYYVMAVFFGSLHTWPPFSIVSNWSWIIIQGAPQIWMGLYLGYIRLVYSLKWSMATHMTLNSSLFFLTMISG